VGYTLHPRGRASRATASHWLAAESHNLILSDPVWRSSDSSDLDIFGKVAKGKVVKMNGESYIITGGHASEEEQIVSEEKLI
jgi:hypothetical protein